VQELRAEMTAQLLGRLVDNAVSAAETQVDTPGLAQRPGEGTHRHVNLRYTDEPLSYASVALKGSLAKIAALSYERPAEFVSHVDRTGPRFSLTRVRTRERFVPCDLAGRSRIASGSV